RSDRRGVRGMAGRTDAVGRGSRVGRRNRGGRGGRRAGGADHPLGAPAPRYPGRQLAFVYNVYTEPAHRRRGVARLLMDAIHAWCREHDVSSVALNASADGRPLYEAMGYVVAPSPMMFFSIVGV